MQTLKALLRGVESGQAPVLWKLQEEVIAKQASHALQIRQQSGAKVYGSSTYTGHRDAQNVSSTEQLSINNEIIRTHTIGFGAGYSPYQVQCISYTKMYSLAAGHSGISIEAYRLLSELCANPGFQPYVPKNASYSSGDVIPAAHWAKPAIETLDEKGLAQEAGLAMCLINGNFVHVGLNAALVRPIEKCFLLFTEVSALQVFYGAKYSSGLFYGASPSRLWASQVIKHIRERTGSTPHIAPAQDPISIRGIPQAIEALCVALESYLTEIDHLLTQPSGNPLFDLSVNQPLSQASFLAPSLTIKASGLIDALLFCAWSVVGRTTALLDGTRGFPQDGGDENSPLGLIQLPKLMMAKLQSARIKFGTRPFVTGSSTSYGVEDLWTNGVSQTEQLSDLLEIFFELCALEAYAISYLVKKFPPQNQLESTVLNRLHACSSAKEAVEMLNGLSVVNLFPDSLQLFPMASGQV